MCFTRVSASIKTAFAFTLVWVYNACISHACLHLLRRLLRFPWYCIKVHLYFHACLHLLRRLLLFSSYRFSMHAFHTRVCIGFNDYCVFLGMALQCMCFTRVSASVKTTSAFSLVWRYNACVSHACLHCLKRLLSFPWCTCFSHASLHLLIRLSLFPWYGVTMYAFHTRVCKY